MWIELATLSGNRHSAALGGIASGQWPILAILAERSGLYLQGLVTLEIGSPLNPRWKTVKAIADARGVSCDEIRWVGNETPHFPTSLPLLSTLVSCGEVAHVNRLAQRATQNPWRAPWILQLMEFEGWVKY